MSLTRILHRLFPIALATLCVASILVLLPAIHRDVSRPAVHLAKSALSQGSTHFAIADFDGDQRPDLAMIRVSRDGAPSAEYSLELKFSSGTRLPIGLIGPAGGLEISPQDVNGDQIADLVITSVVDAEFVAILVNDGKGDFTQVDRADYPGVGKRRDSRLLVPMSSDVYEFALSQSRHEFGDEAQAGIGKCARPDCFGVSRADARIAADSLVLLNPGRAPPLA